MILLYFLIPGLKVLDRHISLFGYECRFAWWPL